MEEEKRKKRKGAPALFIMVTVAVLLVVAGDYFSFLEAQLFEERRSYIVEFTEKASEIVENMVEYSWLQVNSSEHILRMSHIDSKETLMEILASTSDFINDENTLVLAIDQEGNYYASDRRAGRWVQTRMLTEKAGFRQQAVAGIPHKGARTYLVFMERLEDPLSVGEDDCFIHYLLAAVDIESMQDKISVGGFGDKCYTYLVNDDGSRLYKYTYQDHFIEGYNILNSFRDYNIIHGESYEDFVQDLQQDRNGAFEFEYVDADGREENWFVANAAISSAEWHVLLFVPTDVLGFNSALLMKRTLRFFVTVSAAVVAMVAIIIVVTMISRGDRRLLQQKEEANRLLTIAAREAESANRAKSDFLSHMSHDIRTPINGIMGMTEIALKHVDSQEKVRDCLGKIGSSSRHLLGLVNDVLDMSRIESGKTKLNHENFDLRACMDNCISIVGGQLTDRKLELRKEAEEFEHPLLTGDELHLRQVFINILGNSVKFTPDGGRITFRGKEIESAEGRALFRFELEDTGIGMKEEFLPHLFEAFSQEDGGTRTTYKGTGLGMAITKKFLDMMGASVQVTSRINEGTRFVIELWMDIDTSVKEKAEAENGKIDVKGMKVLLVEDIALNLEIARTILEEEGVIVTAAMNGREAVDTFAGQPQGTFDLILMDIMMPVMDGISAAKAIRGLPRPDAGTVPIVAMTANAFEEDVQKTREAGMNAHLSKPIDVEAMLQTLSRFYHASGADSENGG